MTSASHNADATELLAWLRYLVRTNYERAAAHQATDGLAYQHVADTLSAAHPATWTQHAAALSAPELADQIAAALFIGQRKMVYGTPEYTEIDGIRTYLHSLRRTTT